MAEAAGSIARDQAPASQTSWRHMGHAYAIRKSPTNDTNPPRPGDEHDAQIAGASASIVATRNARPVVGHGIVEGPACCRDRQGVPSPCVYQTNNP
jgi:hypothetical protein